MENINRDWSQCVNNLCSAKHEQSVKLTNNLCLKCIHHTLSVMCRLIFSTGCSCGANNLLSTQQHTNTPHEPVIKAHAAYTHRADLQVLLSMTNAAVCFAVMLFPCSAVWNSLPRHLLELIMTSPLAAPLCVCVEKEREGTKGGAREFVGAREVREKQGDGKQREKVRGKKVTTRWRRKSFPFIDF